MKIIEINSKNSATFKRFLRLKNPRYIRKDKRALLSGPKQTREALAAHPRRCAGIIFSSRHRHRDLAGADAVPQYRLSPELFRQLDVFGTGEPLVIILAEPFPTFDRTRCGPGCTLFVPFQDPGNVGAAVRASAAFGVNRIVLLEEAVHPFHPKALRAAGSSIFRVSFFRGPSIRQLKNLDISLIIMSTKGIDAARFKFPERFCLLPGLEGPGVPETLKGSGTISIPMANGVESLNAAMATGIILYLWRNQLVRSEMRPISDECHC